MELAVAQMPRAYLSRSFGHTRSPGSGFCPAGPPHSSLSQTPPLSCFRCPGPPPQLVPGPCPLGGKGAGPPEWTVVSAPDPPPPGVPPALCQAACALRGEAAALCLGDEVTLFRSLFSWIILQFLPRLSNTSSGFVSGERFPAGAILARLRRRSSCHPPGHPLSGLLEGEASCVGYGVAWAAGTLSFAGSVSFSPSF